MDKLRILVCGGRHFDNYTLLNNALAIVLCAKQTVSQCVEIVSGHCEGADSLAEKWAENKGASLKIFPANWTKYKKSAGPIRNKQMVDYITCFNDKLVVAFVSPNSKGTRNTISLAKKNNIPVLQIQYVNGENKVTYEPPRLNASEEDKVFGDNVSRMIVELSDTEEVDEDLLDFYYYSTEDKGLKWHHLHTEMHQIIVSKKELYWQLRNFDIQENLFKLFIVDKNSHKYAKLLNLLGVKFELIGAFNYISKVGGERHLVKPPIGTYYRYIFDNYCEHVDEVRTEAYPYKEGKDNFSKEEKEKLFKKYRAVRYYTTPMLATMSEQNYTAIFMGILDYVAKNDDFPETSFNQVTGFPEVLRGKVKDFDWRDHDVHR